MYTLKKQAKSGVAWRNSNLYYSGQTESSLGSAIFTSFPIGIIIIIIIVLQTLNLICKNGKV